MLKQLRTGATGGRDRVRSPWHGRMTPVTRVTGPRSEWRPRGMRPHGHAKQMGASESADRPSQPGSFGRSRGRYSEAHDTRAAVSQSPSEARPSSRGTCLRLFQINLPATVDKGKDDVSISYPMRVAVSEKLGCMDLLPVEAIRLVRKSFDSRRNLFWVYVVDVDEAAVVACRGYKDLPIAQGLIERVPLELSNAPYGSRRASTAAPEGSKVSKDGEEGDEASTSAPKSGDSALTPLKGQPTIKLPKPVVVVGSGPAGLFAALTLAEAGLPVVMLERGQPVEQRGKDIGALFVRGKLNPESNLCYGEGGAGTWSDGKLTTKIGRNSDPVRRVLDALVDFGAPENILVSGKPHMGTERMVRILKLFRQHLINLGVKIHFGSQVKEVVSRGGAAVGVKMTDGEVIEASSVVLAVGHSARAMYRSLLDQGVLLSPKPFAMGFRIEHPQSFINEAQYGRLGAVGVERGKGPIPVADYRFAVEVNDVKQGRPQDRKQSQLRPAAGQSTPGGMEAQAGRGSRGGRSSMDDYTSSGKRNVPDGMRGVYSFCMCPGGQIVPTSTNPEELCINGMSFSRRNSLWANSALVVTQGPVDWMKYEKEHGPLAGVALQQAMERAGAKMGGGNFVAPVQRVTDFMDGVISEGTLPSSSYRLGVRSAPLHELYTPSVTQAVRDALKRFDRKMNGFIGDHALLHGVETRTSAPVKIERGDDLQSVTMRALYPCGEGAGYAGGIVSAAVDGLKVGDAIIQELAPKFETTP